MYTSREGKMIGRHSDSRLVSAAIRGVAVKGESYRPSRSQKVIVRSNEDGFYYPGVVTSQRGSEYTTVKLMDGKEISVVSSLVIVMAGAQPCPKLYPGNHVLVRVQTKQDGLHPTSNGVCDYYVPGTLQVLPENERKGHALFSIIMFNGRTVFSNRRGIMKIGDKYFTEICNFVYSASHGMQGGDDLTHSLFTSARRRSSAHVPGPPEAQTRSEQPEDSSQKTEIQQVFDMNKDDREDSVDNKELAPVEREERDKSKVEVEDKGGSNEVPPVNNDQGEDSFQTHQVKDPHSLCAILEHQKTQGECIEEHQQQLALIQAKQRDMEHVYTATLTESALKTKNKLDSADIKVQGCDRAVNTDPITEEKCVGTEPSTESRGVGTSSPPHSHISTPTQGSPPHSHTSTPTQGSPPHSHTSTPTQGSSPHHYTSTPAHRTQSAYHSISQNISAVDILDSPQTNQPVLARWSDDGWYYPCMLVAATEDDWWEVADASGDQALIPVSDIIIDYLNCQTTLAPGDYVTALHPEYPYSYCPGQISDISADGVCFSVDLYDGSRSVLPRHEVYRLAQSKYVIDVQYLKRKEQEWVGVACVARNNSDGLYHPGRVERRLKGIQWYLIRWANGSSQAQVIVHMFGSLTRKRPLRIGDCVLALADSGQGICMPAVVTGAPHTDSILVQFCDGQCNAVDPTHCFWISQEYYQHAVEYICSQAPPPSEGDQTSVTDDSDS